MDMYSTGSLLIWLLQIFVLETCILLLAQGTSVEQRMGHSWNSPETAKFCKSHTWFTRQQLKLCQLHPDIIPSVTQGAMQAIYECRYQFRNERWNCPVSNVTGVFGKTRLRTRNPEMAYIQALVSAGIMYDVTKACGTGTILQCGCDRVFGQDNPDVEWKWGGCSDNLEYGNHFTETFIDDSVTKKTAADLMAVQNYKAGRKVIEKNMSIKCKCHGVSGSCTSQVCWNAMPKLRQISEALLKSHIQAYHMMYSKRSLKLRPLQERNRNPSKTDIVYLTPSPDYCEPNKRHGSLGTHGRRCNKTSTGVNGCRLMCCGRGYQTMLRHVTESCHCRFQWCCSVECETCSRVEELHVCN